ncbi:MAG: hypothetical protein FJW32_10550 [Acidobacteria bacterium]|nr:hypothetical protein [Acidobacteriota bacterium]
MPTLDTPPVSRHDKRRTKGEYVSLPVRKLADLIPRKPAVAALSPYTPAGLPDLPEGAITEIYGPRSSGRATLLHAALAAATNAGELCALIDAADAFDPCSASHAGVHLNRLLWVRSHHDAHDALKAADLVLHAGGFKLIALDLCGADTQRIPISWWRRLRLAVENTSSILLVTTDAPLLRQAATIQIALETHRALWSGTLFEGADIAARQRKPMQIAPAPTILHARTK